MATLESVMNELKAKGSEQTRKTYVRHGIPADKTFGVSNADLKVIAKTIKRQQDLALELYATGYMDAMYLAGIVADGAKMDRDRLNAWAEGAAGMPMISEYPVPWVALESAFARDLALEWIDSGSEHVASSGWCTYSGIVGTKDDKDLDLAEIEQLLNLATKQIATAPNRAKYTMNGFVISVGSYVAPLVSQARAAADQIGLVIVDMGDTACKVPSARDYIAKIETAGKQGQKRKTIRC
jgi:3-methyladenine DNA glycosylase AlkD